MDPAAERESAVDAMGDDSEEEKSPEAMAGADLRAALAGDDDEEVYEAFKHLLARCKLGEKAPEEEGSKPPSALVVAIGKARKK